ncbi:PrgI family protein [Candidatus Peregrinibacteria bacterium]|nr:PrgI family protein [Candidatus Peregrinibacteria bacterium]
MNLNFVQYKIPQNVGIEDRIVGPLTLRQLIILAAGFGISYVLFAILSKLYELNVLEYIIILVPALFAAAFALIKINDIRLPKFILLFLEFAMKPKKRLWDHRGIATIVAPDLSELRKEEPKDRAALDEKAKQVTNLRELAHMLDSGSFEHIKPTEHKKIDEADDDDLIAEAYFGHKDSSTGNMYWRTKKTHMKMLELFAKLPITKVTKGSREAEIMKREIAEVKAETEAGKGQPALRAMPATPPAAQANAVPSRPNKKPRKRKRKIPQPVRTDNHVNTTQKNQPAQYLPKSDPAKNRSPEKTKKEAPKKDGEFKFEELKKGEIEINLD